MASTLEPWILIRSKNWRWHCLPRLEPAMLRKQYWECSLVGKDFMTLEPWGRELPLLYQPGHFGLREYLQTLGSPGWWTELSIRKVIFSSCGETEWVPRCLSKSNIPASSFPVLQKAYFLSFLPYPPLHPTTMLLSFFFMDDFSIEFGPRAQIHFPTHFH